MTFLRTRSELGVESDAEQGSSGSQSFAPTTVFMKFSRAFINILSPFIKQVGTSKAWGKGQALFLCRRGRLLSFEKPRGEKRPGLLLSNSVNPFLSNRFTMQRVCF